MANLVTLQVLQTYVGAAPPASGGISLARLAAHVNRTLGAGRSFYSRNPRVADWIQVYRGTVWADLTQQQWDDMLTALLAAIDD